MIHPGIAPLFLRYVGVTLGVTLIGAALAAGLLYLGYPFPMSAPALIAPGIAAFVEGQRYGTAVRSPVDPGFAWRAALTMTVWAMGIHILLSVLSVNMIGHEEYGRLTRSVGPGLWTVLLLSITAMTLLINRGFFGLGVRQGLKTQDT